MNEKGMSGSTLKIIAMITMLIDHIGAVILEPLLTVGLEQSKFEIVEKIYMTLRFIGRIAFPIFLFLLVEGYIHTHDKKKYARNLFVFALISEIPFDLAFNGKIVAIDYQNVMVTLFLAFLAIWIFDTYRKEKPVYAFGGAILLVVLAQALKTDYAAFGVVSALIFYHTWVNGSKVRFYVCGILVFLWELTAPLAFLPIKFYNGKRGISVKYVFYFFYPVHLLLLWGLRKILLGI